MNNTDDIEAESNDDYSDEFERANEGQDILGELNSQTYVNTTPDKGTTPKEIGFMSGKEVHQVKDVKKDLYESRG